MKAKVFCLAVLAAVFPIWGGALNATLQNPYSYQVLFEIDSLHTGQMEGFAVITIPGEDGICGQFGKPQFPAVRELLPLPAAGGWHIVVVSADTGEIHLSAKGLPSLVYPRQMPRPKNFSHQQFLFNRRWYSDSVFADNSGFAHLREYGTIRGQKVGILEIDPVIFYDPAAGVIKFISSAQIRIEYDSPLTFDAKAYRSPVFARLLADILPIPADIPPAPDFPIVYWVIYPAEFHDAIAPFIVWKRQMGYDVMETELPSPPSEDELAAAIQSAYDTLENSPDFVLLVGDVDQIPAHNTGMHYTDLYYFTTDGDDYLPDILYGRFSCSTPEQVSAIVEKTLVHEKFLMGSVDYLRHPVFVACGTDGDWELAESTHRYVFTTYLTPPEFEPESLWAYDGATGSDVLDAINEGALLVNYSGHGYHGGWGNPSVSSSDIATLTNEGMYPLVISNACLTGKFDMDECFGEAWIRADGKGAVAFIGASNSTYWNEDDVWERRWYDAVFEEGYTSIAGATYWADLAVDLASSEGQYYFEVYHNLGDPSLYLYWGEPTPITVDFSHWYGILPLGEDFYDIPVSEDGALVSIWRDSVKVGAAISSGGVAHIVPEYSFTEPGSAVVVATKPNFFSPFIQTVSNEYLCLYSMSPESLMVNADNDFEITLLAGDSSGIEGARVIIRGLGVCETTFTDADGHASMTVNPPYGETLALEAYSGDRKILSKTIPTYGAEDWSVDSLAVWVPAVELAGSLAVGFEGNIVFTLSEPDFRCVIEKGDSALRDTTFAGDGGEIALTPEDETPLEIKFAKVGYLIHTAEIPVVIARGPFNGTIADTSGTPITVRAQLTFIHGTDTISTFRSDWDGTFSLPGNFVCDTYTVAISAFGYYDTTYTFLLTTQGNYEFNLTPAPRSEIFVDITDTEGNPISAEIQLLTTSTSELVSSGTEMYEGHFYLSSQPFTEYVLCVRSRGYSPQRVVFTPSGDTTTVDVVLEPNDYDILIVDLTSDGLTGTFLKRDLDSLGFSDTVITEFPDTAQMWRYNLVIVASGLDSNTMTSSYLASLLDYHRKGGRIVFEGGDVAYQVIASGTFSPTYARYLLHLSEYHSDVVGDSGLFVTSVAQDSFVFFYPNFLLSRYSTYSGLMRPTQFDVVSPSEDAYLVYHTRADSTAGCIVIFPDSEHRGFARSAFFGAAYNNAFISSTSAAAIMANLVEYILPSVSDTGYLYGKVMLESGAPGFLTQIRAVGSEVVVDSAFGDGRYVIAAKPGGYEVTFSRTGYRDTTVTVALSTFPPTHLNITLRYGEYVYETLPEKLLIGSPQPNPFNGAVAIDFVNPSGGKLRAKITDINGRQIAEFNLDGKRQGKLVWRPEDATPSGVYFVSFNFEKRRILRKVIYIK